MSHVWRTEDNRGEFSLFTMWILGIEFKLLDLEARVFYLLNYLAGPALHLILFSKIY